MRLDIEMMSRSYPLWRTDCNYGEPTCQQSHNYGLAQFLPVHGTGIFYADDYCIHSALGPTMVFNIEIFGRDAQLSQLQKVINTHKKYKSYFWADYYPLSGDGSTLGKDINLATQWNRPSDDSGLIVLFRRDESPNESITVKLKGLDANAIYRIKDTDSGEITEHRGADLMNGVTFKIGPKRSSRLLHYSK
jgi:alpha-galactosidase